jgi:TetR/AcrR family transcriptional repressor of nem operon
MPRKIGKEVALERALTLFWDHGYRGTSMDMLVAELGVEKPSIYASFGSKHLLYMAALEHYRKSLVDTVRGILFDTTSARAGIVRATQMLMSPNARKTRKGCFATNSALELADHDPLVRTEIRKAFAELVAEFELAFRRAQIAREVRTDHPPEVLAHLIVNAIEGARIMEKTRVPKEIMAAVASLVVGALDGAVASPAKDPQTRLGA